MTKAVQPRNAEERAERSRHRSRAFAIFAAGAMAAAIALTIFVIAYKQQESQTRSQKTYDNTADTKKILKIVQCYTVPTESCYKANQKNQANLLAVINTYDKRAAAAAASCAVELPNPTFENVLACVEKEVR